MESTNQNETVLYLNKLLEKTKAGSTEWTQSNPTTYSWTRAVHGSNGKVILQKVDRTLLLPDPVSRRFEQKIDSNYIFQVYEDSKQIISIVTAENSQYKEILGSLFIAVEENISKKGLNFLKNMLRD